MKSSKLRRVLSAVLLSATFLAAGCGDDDDDSSNERRAGTGDTQRYCEHVRQLDRAGSEFFKPLEQNNATPKQFKSAEKRFVQTHQAELDELKRAAPVQIGDDVKTLIASQRARAGLGPAVDEAKTGAAERRVQRFEKRACK